MLVVGTAPEVRPVGASARGLGTLALLAALMLAAALTPSVATAAPAAPTAALPGLAAQASGAACGPAPEGQIALVMVIDRGTGTPSTRCAIVPQGSNGLDALRATGHSVRLDGGFVCAIDGLPATGCGNIPGSPYWRYWHAAPGGGPWSYSQVGAGGYRLPTRCAVEGWVWSDSPSPDTPPRIAPPRPTCEAPPTTAPAPPTTARPPSGGGTSLQPSSPAPSTPPPSAGGGPSGAPGASGRPVEGPAATTTPPARVSGVTTSRPPAGEGDAAEAEPPDGDTSEELSASAATSSGRSEGPDGPDGPEGGSDGEMAVGTSDGGSSTPWGVLVAVALILALGTAASVRSRARSRHADPEPI